MENFRNSLYLSITLGFVLLFPLPVVEDALRTCECACMCAAVHMCLCLSLVNREEWKMAFAAIVNYSFHQPNHLIRIVNTSKDNNIGMCCRSPHTRSFVLVKALFTINLSDVIKFRAFDWWNVHFNHRLLFRSFSIRLQNLICTRLEHTVLILIPFVNCVLWLFVP